MAKVDQTKEGGPVGDSERLLWEGANKFLI